MASKFMLSEFFLLEGERQVKTEKPKLKVGQGKHTTIMIKITTTSRNSERKSKKTREKRRIITNSTIIPLKRTDITRTGESYYFSFSSQ